MSTGERMKKARKAAGLTQGQLGQRIRKTKSLIWNYESGYREPDEKALCALAETLGVIPQSLKDLELDSVQDVLEALFQMDESDFGIELVETKNGVMFAINPDVPHAPKLAIALKKWSEHRKALKGADISQYEYATRHGSNDSEDAK